MKIKRSNLEKFMSKYKLEAIDANQASSINTSFKSNLKSSSVNPEGIKKVNNLYNEFNIDSK